MHESRLPDSSTAVAVLGRCPSFARLFVSPGIELTERFHQDCGTAGYPNGRRVGTFSKSTMGSQRSIISFSEGCR